MDSSDEYYFDAVLFLDVANKLVQFKGNNLHSKKRTKNETVTATETGLCNTVERPFLSCEPEIYFVQPGAQFIILGFNIMV